MCLMESNTTLYYFILIKLKPSEPKCRKYDDTKISENRVNDDPFYWLSDIFIIYLL